MSKTCSITTCEQSATVRVYWPGRVPAPQMCSRCAARAKAVAKAMGFALVTELLEVSRADAILELEAEDHESVKCVREHAGGLVKLLLAGHFVRTKADDA